MAEVAAGYLPILLFLAIGMGFGLVLVILGFFLDYIEIAFIHLPVISPVLLQMGFDPLWYGVLLGVNLQLDLATVFVDTKDGSQLWATRYTAENETNWIPSVALSPDARTVYVAAPSRYAVQWELPSRYTTLAYDAATGAQLWEATYGGPPGSSQDSARSLAVDPNGARVYVTGFAAGSGTGLDFATVAYDAAILSQAVGRPVRVQLSRRDEMAWENYGVAYVSEERAAIDDDGTIAAWDYESWTPTRGGRPGAGTPGAESGADSHYPHR